MGPPYTSRALLEGVRSCRVIAAMVPCSGFDELGSFARLGFDFEASTLNLAGAAIAPLCAVCVKRVIKQYHSERRLGRN